MRRQQIYSYSLLALVLLLFLNYIFSLHSTLTFVSFFAWNIYLFTSIFRMIVENYVRMECKILLNKSNTNITYQPITKIKIFVWFELANTLFKRTQMTKLRVKCKAKQNQTKMKTKTAFINGTGICIYDRWTFVYLHRMEKIDVCSLFVDLLRKWQTWITNQKLETEQPNWLSPVIKTLLYNFACLYCVLLSFLLSLFLLIVRITELEFYGFA